jgi:hemolysin activation/secretion protein
MRRINCAVYSYLLHSSLILLLTWATGERGLGATAKADLIINDQSKNRHLMVSQASSENGDAENSAQPGEPVSDRFFVSDIKVTDSEVFEQDELESAVAPFEGQELTLEELRGVADAVTQLYIDAGYITSRAVLVEQPLLIDDGVVEIRVIEGQLQRIEIEGNRRLNSSYIRSRLQFDEGAALNTIQLEERLRLLRLDPLFDNVEASLQPTGEIGQSILAVRVTETNPFGFSFNIDNYSPPSIGSERLGLDLRYRNLTGIGDELSGSYYFTTTGGADVFDFAYQVPLNAMNGTLRLRAAPNRNEITQPPFDELSIEGSQELYEVTYRQPLIRSTTQEFALSFGFTYQDGQTFVFDLPTPFGIGPDEEGVSRTSVFSFGQDYIRRDPQGAWAMRSQFSLGVDLFNATINDSPTPDGRFFSWLGQVQRVQQLGDDHLLLISADLQLTPDSLLPPQQFIIGGGQSVRGYRQSVRSGDNGFRVSIEDRITIFRNESGAPTVQLTPFLDAGLVWNQPGNPNILPDQTFLVGAGLGLLINQPFNLDGFSMRVDYGYPFVDLDDRGNNAQDDGFYFSVRYQY